MPKVGTKEFEYSDRGKSMAHAYAEKTGQEVEYAKGYAHGGPVGVVHTQSMTKQKDKYMPKGVKLAKGADPAYINRGCGTMGMIGAKRKEIT